ncbi:hypothetical protein GCM10023229_26640 [Flavisolibacter ginsenosidimutans]
MINEYMPWTSNGCGTTAEFIELLNMGPGPVNLGGYILTTGKYAVTIPPNTLLQPGKFFVLSGEDFIPNDCGNIDSIATGVHANLNWNTCGCTNVAIPTTGDGMMTDGGASNTPLVLFDPSLNLVDAVVRSLPAETSTSITTSTVGGTCTAKTFDLGSMSINYEQLGMSAGRGNSFARTVDGDCQWVKDPQQSANATNNRPGDAASITYTFSLIDAFACGASGGRVSIYVNANNYASIFPMQCLLAYDADNNGVFDFNDVYTKAVDSTAPTVDINGLAAGRYRITVSTANNCSVKSFDFTIVSCLAPLPVQLNYFTYVGQQNGHHLLQWKVSGIEALQKTVVQKAKNNETFSDDETVQETAGANGSKAYTAQVEGNYRFFRLKMFSRSGKEFYSPVISAGIVASAFKIWPNPSTDVLHLRLNTSEAGKIAYVVYNVSGKPVQKGETALAKGETVFSLPVSTLLPGMYQLQINGQFTGNQPICFRFVKH